MKVKYKGAYVFENLEYHKNQSALVIPRAACAVMLEGVDLREYLMSQKDPFDFMLRTKVPRSSRLILRTEDGDVEQQRICRYYPSKAGGKLIKVMPPLAGKEEAGERELGIDTAWDVSTCNNMDDFSWDNINYDYYIAEAEKLIINA